MPRRLLLATLNELGVYVAGASDGSAAHERAVTTLNVLLERLFGAGGRRSLAMGQHETTTADR